MGAKQSQGDLTQEAKSELCLSFHDHQTPKLTVQATMNTDFCVQSVSENSKFWFSIRYYILSLNTKHI